MSTTPAIPPGIAAHVPLKVAGVGQVHPEDDDKNNKSCMSWPQLMAEPKYKDAAMPKLVAQCIFQLWLVQISLPLIALEPFDCTFIANNIQSGSEIGDLSDLDGKLYMDSNPAILCTEEDEQWSAMYGPGMTGTSSQLGSL